MTLDEQLTALCAKHGLNALSVDVHYMSDGGHFFGSYAHKEGKCGSASTRRTRPSDAISEAITDVLAKCGEALVAVPELEAA